jgi:hypothetical protein
MSHNLKRQLKATFALPFFHCGRWVSLKKGIGRTGRGPTKILVKQTLREIFALSLHKKGTLQLVGSAGAALIPRRAAPSTCRAARRRGAAEKRLARGTRAAGQGVRRPRLRERPRSPIFAGHFPGDEHPPGMPASCCHVKWTTPNTNAS